MNIRDLLIGTWTILSVPEEGRACTIEGDNGRKISVVASLSDVMGLMITARAMSTTGNQVAHLSSLSDDEKTKVLARIKNPGRLREYPGARWIDMSVAQVVRGLKN